jgi:ferredoxin-NADP reductase
MEKHIVKVLDTFEVTHNVKGFRVEKPDGYLFLPGQATDVAINRQDWQEERRPFTFTNLPEEDELEFMIKTYPERNGVTNQLRKISRDDELILHDVFGDITYKGKGVFIAGGAGITPFISIFRQLKAANDTGSNMLIFANKFKKDIILEEEFKNSLRRAFINILDSENVKGYEYGKITEAFLKKHINNFDLKFYICGPPPMMDAVLEQLSHLGVKADSIIQEG